MIDPKIIDVATTNAKTNVEDFVAFMLSSNQLVVMLVVDVVWDRLEVDAPVSVVLSSTNSLLSLLLLAEDMEPSSSSSTLGAGRGPRSANITLCCCFGFVEIGIMVCFTI